jgi:aminopeptidase N
MPRIVSPLVFCCLIAAFPQFALAADSGRIVLPTDVTPLHYDIAITPAVATKTFTGSVKIVVDVKAPTRTIELNAAELTFGKVSLSGAPTPSVAFDNERETATLTFPKPVSAGRHTLSIDYSGKINQHASGLFALDYEAANGKKNALFTQFENSDARRGTHPIIQPIRDVLQANEAFDTITYSKGQAVIRMLESYVGEDAFRTGVRNYIKKHVYGNTVTDDLWRELDKTSSTPVSQIAHDFTLQAGVPLIRVATTANGVHLTQDRVADDDSGKLPTSWHVPVTVQAVGGAKAWHGIVTRETPQDVAVRGKTAAIVNVGQTSYFRTAYDAASFKPIVSQFHALTPEDQLGLINDARAEGYVGIAPFSNFLQLAGQATPDFNPIVLDTLAGRMQGIDELYRELKGQPAYRAFALSVLQPIFAKVGWMPVPGEDQNIALLRNDLIDALSQLGDPAVVAEAKRRFAGFVKDQSSLTGDLRRSVLTTVAFHADAAIWEQLHALAKGTNDSMQKNEYYLLIGLSEDKSIAERALALSLTDEAPVTARPTIVAAVSNWYPEMAFDFAVAHLDQFNALLEPDSRNQYEVRLASGSFQPEMVAKVQAYAEAHIPATARQTAVKTEAVIASYAQIRAKYLPEIDSWLAHHKA